jgi:hypothetical protein
LFSAGFDAGGVEALGEAAVFFEVFGLTLDLAFEQVGSLIDGAEQGVGVFGLKLTGLRRGTTWLQRGREGVSSAAEPGDWDQSPSRAPILK